MGLFWLGDAPAAKVAGPRKNIKVSASEMRLLNCSHCSLDRASLGSPKLAPSGPDSPLLYVIGEHLTKADDDNGEHFSGLAGRMLRNLIPERYQEMTRWNNVIRCRPQGEVKSLDINCCRRLQVADIEQSKPAVILAVGPDAIKWFLGNERAAKDWRGRMMPTRVGSHTAWLCCIESPVFIAAKQQDRKMGEAHTACFKRDVARLIQKLDNGLPDPFVQPEAGYQEGLVCLEEYGKGGLDIIENHLVRFMDVDHAVDIETNMLRPYSTNRKILTVAIGDFADTLAFGWMHPECRWTKPEQKIIEDMLHGYLLGKGRKWAHRAVFEQEWFHSYYGPEVIYDTPWGDTLGQAHVIDERYTKSLGELTLLYFGFDVKKLSDVNVNDMEHEPLHNILPYNGMDTKYTDALSYIQADILEEENLTATYNLLHAGTPSFVSMQAKGVHRNIDEIEKQDKHLTAESNKIKLAILNDPDVVAYKAGGSRVFSPTSGPNLISFFRDFLKVPNPGRGGGEGKYSVDEDALVNINHPVAQAVIKLRSNDKNHGYVTPLLPGGKYVHADGLVHASYSQYVTVSGRAACQEPNQQNYPRRKNKEIRRVIGCPLGYVWVSCDYGQIEVRVIASASQDPVLCQEVFDGQDVHGTWTDRIGARFLPKHIKEKRKQVRDILKSQWTFANFYGNELNAVAYDIDRSFKDMIYAGARVTADELKPIFDDFWRKYKGVKAWQDEMMKDYWAKGYVATGTGQRRHEPMSRNEIGNHFSQGTAGHLVINAQRKISEYAYRNNKPHLQPIMNIHDDLSFYLPEDSLADDIEIIARLMCTDTFDFITVPLTVEVSVGTNWADKEEIHTFNTRDFQ
jgi:uracil-DNA glycosylase family 4